MEEMRSLVAMNATSANSLLRELHRCYAPCLDIPLCLCQPVYGGKNALAICVGISPHAISSSLSRFLMAFAHICTTVNILHRYVLTMQLSGLSMNFVQYLTSILPRRCSMSTSVTILLMIFWSKSTRQACSTPSKHVPLCSITAWQNTSRHFPRQFVCSLMC